MNLFNTWIGSLQGLCTIIAALIGGFWVWSRLVVERGLLPPSAMDLDLKTIGSSDLTRIVEATIQIHNQGAATLVVTDLRIRLRYLNGNDRIDVFDDPAEATFGRVKFPHAHVLNGVGENERVATPVGIAAKARPKLGRGEFLVVPHDTFVQAGVRQPYSFVTALPTEAAYVLARASFRYEVRPSKTQLLFLKIARRIGILQFSLDHIREPHTVERSFKIG